MPLRAFIDPSGVHWEVWEAHPTLVERRSPIDRRSVVRGEEKRRLDDRPSIDADSGGWLVFRSENQRRRQRPIPPEWDKLADEELVSLLTQSRPSGQRSRVIE